MADVRVDLNPAFLPWLAGAPDSPVNIVLDATIDLVHSAQVAHAPVSPVGSRQAPRGFLRSRIVIADKENDDNGELIRYSGTRINRHGGADPVPLAYIDNDAGFTWNPRHKSRRGAHNHFIIEALDEIPYIVYEV